MKDSAEGFYGNPIPLAQLLEAYELFGRDSLPDDSLRPDDKRHRMNGEQMWFNWAAFVDSMMFYGENSDFWQAQTRAVILGLLNDGLLRERFTVTGFDKNDNDIEQKLREYTWNIKPDNLSNELRKRFTDTNLSLPF